MQVVSENDQHYQNDALNNQMTNVERREYLIREMSQYSIRTLKGQCHEMNIEGPNNQIVTTFLYQR